jgi:hypothetical protein
MDDFTATLTRLDEQLTAATATDPLDALKLIGVAKRNVDDHQKTAVRAAAGKHSWTEIGEALGVSKQAAHQKFAKDWATALREELKAEHKTFKTAMKKGELRTAADAKDRLDAVVEEFKQVGRRAKK